MGCRLPPSLCVLAQPVRWAERESEARVSPSSGKPPVLSGQGSTPMSSRDLNDLLEARSAGTATLGVKALTCEL